MDAPVDPLTHGGLLEVLDRARSLGFTGPGDPRDHIVHALGFVALAGEMVPKPSESGSLAPPLRGSASSALDGGSPMDGPHRPLGIDLGTGGGVPGLVLAVALPWIRWVLVDSMQRRSTILDEAVAQLGMSDRVTVRCCRAEDLGREPEIRHSADLVVARSFGPPAVTAECAGPLLRLGGRLLVSEPPDSGGQRWPAGPLQELGIEPVGVERGIMVLAKVADTPDRYPRRVGVPSKRPLF
jgi:hypothetical protein